MDFDTNKAIAYFRNIVTEHYADFSGRVSRKDFWTFAAVTFAIAIVVRVLSFSLGIGFGLSYLLQLALILPSAGMTARRLQDTGKNGSLVWILMIPVLILQLVGLFTFMTIGVFGLMLVIAPIMFLITPFTLAASLFLIYLCIQPGTPGSNQYGPEPVSAT